MVGARPQFIKATPLALEIRIRHDGFLVTIGQHYDAYMSGMFFPELNIPETDVHLGVGSSPHVEYTAAMLTGFKSVFVERKPNAVIVFGDAHGTVAGALVEVAAIAETWCSCLPTAKHESRPIRRTRVQCVRRHTT